MSGQKYSPVSKPITVDGTATSLIAFYYPDSNTPWDDAYQAPFLGNFWPVDLTLTEQGITGSFHLAEAAFQALKWWTDANVRASFAKKRTGNDAYHLKLSLEQSKLPEDPYFKQHGHDWAMAAVLAAKFDKVLQRDLHDGLLATGDAYLIEHNSSATRDRYWSDGLDGLGGNHLGLALMALRAKLGGSPDPMPGTAVAKFTAHV